MDLSLLRAFSRARRNRCALERARGGRGSLLARKSGSLARSGTFRGTCLFGPLRWLRQAPGRFGRWGWLGLSSSGLRPGRHGPGLVGLGLGRFPAQEDHLIGAGGWGLPARLLRASRRLLASCRSGLGVTPGCRRGMRCAFGLHSGLSDLGRSWILARLRSRGQLLRGLRPDGLGGRRRARRSLVVLSYRGLGLGLRLGGRSSGALGPGLCLGLSRGLRRGRG